jgi:hypothetical protein
MPHDSAMLHAASRKASAGRRQVLMRAVMQLTRVDLVDVQDRGDLPMRALERFAQHEHRPFSRGEPLEEDQEARGDAVALLDRLQRTELVSLGEDGLPAARIPSGVPASSGPRSALRFAEPTS